MTGILKAPTILLRLTAERNDFEEQFVFALHRPGRWIGASDEPGRGHAVELRLRWSDQFLLRHGRNSLRGIEMRGP